jgi:hypothetical protein
VCWRMIEFVVTVTGLHEVVHPSPLQSSPLTQKPSRLPLVSERTGCTFCCHGTVNSDQFIICRFRHSGKYLSLNVKSLDFYVVVYHISGYSWIQEPSPVASDRTNRHLPFDIILSVCVSDRLIQRSESIPPHATIWPVWLHISEITLQRNRTVTQSSIT